MRLAALLLLSASAWAARLQTADVAPRPALEPVPLASAALELPAAAGPASLPAEVQAVVAAANELPVIRVYFASEPGFGHQSATLAAARRLRELGYAGRLEAVFDHADPALPAKLAVLLPGFQPEDVRPQTIPSLGMTVESHEHLSRRMAPGVALALTGGDDNASHERLSRLRSASYLRLNPTGWARTDAVYREGEEEPSVVTALKLLYTPAGAEDARRALDELEGAGGEKARGLRALLGALPAHGLWPVYGLAFMTENVLHDAVLGVALAQQRRPELFGGRGVVAPLLLDAGPKVDRVVQSGDARLAGRLRRASIHDPDLRLQLDRLEPGQLLLLETGPVPPAVFEQLFARATVPPTLEGKNAAALAGFLGIPFLPARSATTLDALNEVVARDAQRVAEAAFLLGARDAGGRSTRLFSLASAPGADEIARFVAEAMRPGSPLRRLFADLRQRPDDFARDKVLRGLEAALSR